jgi:ketosteroid isomerase-like protein
MLLAARPHDEVMIRSLGKGAAMSDDPVRSAASTPEALHAIIVDAFKHGDVDAFLAAHEEDASVVVPPGGTYAHGLDEIRAATAPIISLRPHMTSVVYKTLRSNELALTHASWDLDGTAPDGIRTQLSGTGTIVSRRGPAGLGGSCSTIRRAGPLRRPHVSFMEGPDPRPSICLYQEITVYKSLIRIKRDTRALNRSDLLEHRG